jgi:hypothetical protein
MVNPEIRRLQVLNDLIAQTLDVITQRSMLTGGLSHSPFVPELGGGQINPFVPYSGVTQGIGQLGINPWIGQQANPFATPYTQANPFTQGLSHTPFMGYPVQPALSQFSPGVPFGTPWSQGLMHSPFNPGLGYGQYGQFPQQFGQPFGQQVPFNPWTGGGIGVGRFGAGYNLPYVG